MFSSLNETKLMKHICELWICQKSSELCWGY